MSEIACEKCGAPAKPGEVLCEFCRAPVSADAARSSVPCPQCRELNLHAATQCVKCKFVEQCVFCNHVSPFSEVACGTCNEPFAGAKERKAARDEERRRQQLLQTGVAVAGVALPFLGALLGGSSSSSSSSSDQPAQSTGAGGGLLGELGGALSGFGEGSSGVQRRGGGDEDK